MLLVIDNYDSFTYNLVQYLAELGAQIRVVRNDAIGLDQIAEIAPRGILLSPGPGRPEDAGISMNVVEHFRGKIPILGVCLGHQAIAAVYGGSVVRAERLMHGRTSQIHHVATGLFEGLPTPFVATRYHSLIVERSTLPKALAVTAWTAEDEIMAFEHRADLVFGLQFHPESFLSEHGFDLLAGFLRLLPQEAAEGSTGGVTL